jgi:asparagine synthase (glutamine-hydrolysing)
MCGIAGIYNFADRAPADTERLRKAAAALAHRGPDDEGTYCDGEAGLANRRLSIIDLPGGHQPLSNEDESLWVTFNGEIYNFRELRSRLVSRGHQFRTASDTEVILHLYEEQGDRCVEELRGMFAFAVWDSRRRRLFLARDRLGVKPVFYRVSWQGITFASELRALGQLAADPFEIDCQSVYDFFTFRYIPAPFTFYRNVLKLPPGHILLADSNGVTLKCYWDVPSRRESPITSSENLAAEVLECLRESIRMRLIADVPLGLFLSGGTDSSAIVALMRDSATTPVRTFSAGFEDAAYNELPFARRVAERYSTEHQEVMVRASDIASELPRLVSLRYEPVAEPTDVALYLLARLAARTVKVVLAGEGGDELFAGYPKYAAEKLAKVVSIIPLPITRAIAGWLPYSQRRARIALEALSTRDEAQRTVAWFASFLPHESRELFSPDFLAEVDVNHPAKVLREVLDEDPTRSALKRMLYADLKIWLPDNLLLRGDQMTMAASIEERVPFLDHKLVELAAGIPDHLLIRGLKTKAFFRSMLDGALPREALRRRKVGFAVPVGPWFRGALKPMVGDLVLSPRAVSRGYFNKANVERFALEHVKGIRDRRKELWALLNFELWQRQLGNGGIGNRTIEK